MRMTIPTTGELLERLRPALEPLHGPIKQLDRRASAYRTSFPLEELALTFGDGRRIELTLKLLDRALLSDACRAAKPEFIHDPCREIVAYDLVLRSAALGTAKCLLAFADDASGQHWLVLETVPGVELYQIGDVGTWEEVARWLARFHRWAAAQSSWRQGAAAAHLLKWDRSLCDAWLARAREFALHAPAVAAVLARLAPHWNACASRLTSTPPVFLHGEFYPSNILVDCSQQPSRVCPIDWEMAAIGPAALDVAALTSGAWSDADRGRITQSYLREADGELLGADLKPAQTILYGRVQIAVQWLGWARDWRPPAENVHDWCGDLSRLLDQLPNSPSE